MPKQVKSTETEKITVNLGYVDLGRIDLLVEEGFYTNRTDFIRAAIRTQLGAHAQDVGTLIERRTLDIGLRDFTRADLEAAPCRRGGTAHQGRGAGKARPRHPPPIWPRKTIGSITVLGALQASPEVRQALSDRTS